MGSRDADGRRRRRIKDRRSRCVEVEEVVSIVREVDNLKVLRGGERDGNDCEGRESEERCS